MTNNIEVLVSEMSEFYTTCLNPKAIIPYTKKTVYALLPTVYEENI